MKVLGAMATGGVSRTGSRLSRVVCLGFRV